MFFFIGYQREFGKRPMIVIRFRVYLPDDLWKLQFF